MRDFCARILQLFQPLKVNRDRDGGTSTRVMSRRRRLSRSFNLLTYRFVGILDKRSNRCGSTRREAVGQDAGSFIEERIVMGKPDKCIFVNCWRMAHRVDRTDFGVELARNFKDYAFWTKARLFQLWLLVLAPFDCVGRGIRRVVATTPFMVSHSMSAHQTTRTSELQR